MPLQVVEVKESEHRKVEVNYYMLETTQCTADGLEDDIGDEAPVKAFMKAGQLTPIDTYSMAHSQFCKIFGEFNLTRYFFKMLRHNVETMKSVL